jgi:hypothetical protein
LTKAAGGSVPGFKSFAATENRGNADACFESKADIGACPHHVRFTPKSGHTQKRNSFPSTYRPVCIIL